MIQINNLSVGSAKVVKVYPYHLLMENHATTPKNLTITFDGINHKNINIDISRKEAQKLIRLLQKNIEIKIRKPKKLKFK